MQIAHCRCTLRLHTAHCALSLSLIKRSLSINANIFSLHTNKRYTLSPTRQHCAWPTPDTNTSTQTQLHFSPLLVFSSTALFHLVIIRVPPPPNADRSEAKRRTLSPSRRQVLAKRRPSRTISSSLVCPCCLQLVANHAIDLLSWMPPYRNEPIWSEVPLQ